MKSNLALLFEFKALDSYRNVVKELRFAGNLESLTSSLKANGMTLISAKQIKNSSIKNPNINFTIPFLRNLKQLISNKLELITSLEIITNLFPNEESRAIILYMIEGINGGSSLSIVMSQLNRYFDSLTIKIIEISEKTARLSDSIERVITHLETIENTRKNIRSATRYPLILLCCVVFVIMFWLCLIVPKFAELFADVGVDVPLITKAVIRISSMLTGNALASFMTIAIMIVIILATCRNKERLAKILSRIPLISKFNRDMFAMNFFSALDIMTSEKLGLLSGLECLLDSKNGKAISDIISFIRAGNTFSNALRNNGLFTDSEISIVVAGERSGDLCPSLKAISDMLRLKLHEDTKRLISLIQPISVAIIGILLLVIVYSVIMPLYSNLNFYS